MIRDVMELGWIIALGGGHGGLKSKLSLHKMGTIGLGDDESIFFVSGENSSTNLQLRKLQKSK